MNETKVKRKDAAKLIEEIRSLIAANIEDEEMSNPIRIQNILAKFGIEPLEPCDGEAHSNPHIDNCGACAPRWGFSGSSVKVT